ncbi:MAG: GDP-mannose 4,6-dehydratase [Pseudomonadota bacterium]
MKVALVTGISGQDGSYLAELLMSKGYRVVGAVRDVDRARLAFPSGDRGSLDWVRWDMLDEALMRQILERCAPDEFYNLAAYTSGAGMYDDPVGMGEVNGLAVTRMLEAIRAVNPGIRFCQASSREIFGEALESPQTERTRPLPRSPYGAAKSYADAMVRIAREHFGLFACSAILFNHESPRRGATFVTRKITSTAARIKLGLASELTLGNLEARRDWGYAGDYVRAMWLMLQQSQADDYVVATGESHSVRDFCQVAFGHLGLDYRDFVREMATDYRPSEPSLLVGDAGKARHVLGWRPEVGFVELVRMMVDSDMQQLSVKH